MILYQYSYFRCRIKFDFRLTSHNSKKIINRSKKNAMRSRVSDVIKQKMRIGGNFMGLMQVVCSDMQVKKDLEDISAFNF